MTTKAAQAQKGRAPKRASEITPTEVSWLWHPYIARRKLTLIDGDPGAGKSNICLDLTARISTGRAFPGHTEGAQHKPRTVLYLTQEDDLDDTVVPRLMRAGADLSNVLLDDQPLSMGNKEQARDLARLVKSERPALIVLDTLAGYVGGSTDLFRENSVRPVMLDLALIARNYNTSVLALRHLVKGEKTKALYMGQGSMAMVGVARSVMLAATDPNNTSRRGLFHVKSNLAPLADPLGYGFEDDGTLAWHATTDMTMADVMATEGNGEEKKTKTQQCAEVAISMLHQRPQTATTMAHVMDSHEIGHRTYERIRKTLGIRAYQQDGQWWHAIPEDTEAVMAALAEVK